MKECNQCGKCCTKYSDGGLSASQNEIEYWEIFRPDIAEFVYKGEIWIDPNTRDKINRCPWLQKDLDQEIYSCAIYNDRPNDCKYYPVTIEQMIADECEMLQANDLKYQTKAQNQLNILMEDSRPPF
ncbi:hypothetical protein MNBD_GAMMA22-2843 [hydrothermal vent metagenome]|uniref:YkgJ family cysteine cluster protein n=1 Tax=hydrothermal vent metagenome TaxID=652676 RepID=A0A3B1A9K3_9ZZZZ